MAKPSIIIARPAQLLDVRTRREFVRLMGAGGAAVFLPSMLAGCGDDNDNGEGGPTQPDPNNLGEVVLDLSNDTGILNYAYALEQTEATFYTMVVQNFGTSTLTAADQAVLLDIMQHEVTHRDFYRTALGDARIPDLVNDFSTVRFDDRTSVLELATDFEDVGTYAYNAAGKYLTDPTNLLIAGKIASVEARQAAALRNLLRPGTEFFAGDDTVSSEGLDKALEPDVVLRTVDPFVRTALRIGTPPQASA